MPLSILDRPKEKDDLKYRKATLAKLLATENLMVEHRLAQTASFEPKSRTLVLPLWQNIQDFLYDLFVGHEVGHALKTPREYTAEIKKLAKFFHAKLKLPEDLLVRSLAGFVNVVEDCRIEKHIKARYPGIKKSFYEGYKELLERDFFGVDGKDLSLYGFIDKANLYFKCGSSLKIPFSDKELPYLRMIDNCVTFKDVTETVKKIFQFLEDNPECKGDPSVYDDCQEKQKIIILIPGKSGEKDESEGEEESEDSISIPSETSDEEDGDGGEEGDGKAGITTQQGDDESGDSEGNGKGEEGEEKKSAKKSNVLEEGSPGTLIVIIPLALTDEALEENKEKLAEGGTPVIYLSIPQAFPVKDIIIPYKKILNDTKNWAIQNHVGPIDADRFKKQNEAIVAFMAKEFEMRKAAETHNRVSIAKTGILDTNKLHTYKYNDDLFRRISILPEGKNHGLVMFIDWSGSMQDNLAGTIEQLLVLILFCRKVQIPFEVYAFSDGNVGATKEVTFRTEESDIIFPEFRLLQFFSSEMSNRDLEKMFRILLAFRGWDRFYSLSGTPLNESIVAASYIVKRFQVQYQLNKVHTVFLTDGQSNPIRTIKKDNKRSSVSIGEDTILRDRITKYEYKINSSGEDATRGLLEALKDRTGSSIIGFFILPGNPDHVLSQYCESKDVNQARLQMKEKKYFSIKNMGYDDYFLISGGNDLKIKNEKLESPEDFTGFVKRKLVNRILLCDFIRRIA